MIDRNARDELISAVDDFLDDKIMSMELEYRLSDIKSEDPVVNQFIEAIWYHYDSFKMGELHCRHPIPLHPNYRCATGPILPGLSLQSSWHLHDF